MGRGKSCFPVVLMVLAMGGIVFFYQRNSVAIAHNPLLQYLLIGVLFLLGVLILFYMFT